MSLIKTLQEKQMEYSNTDSGWRQYVFDHLTNIKYNSVLVSIPKDEMFRYRYRPSSFLEIKKINREYTWIFLLINQLENNKDFNNLAFVLVMNPDNITKLYNQYDIVSQNDNTETKLL